MNDYLKLTIAILTVFALGLLSVAQAAFNEQINYQGKITDNNDQTVADGAYDMVFKLYTVPNGGTDIWNGSNGESWTNAALWTDTNIDFTEDDAVDCGGDDKLAYTTDTNEGTLVADQYLWNTTRKESAVIKSVDTTGVGGYICVYDTFSVWTDGDDATNRIYVKNGLFSVMLGTITSLSNVDFNQDLWLGVKIGTDSEMTPRKKLGAVPAAFEAKKLGGKAESAFGTLSENEIITGAWTHSSLLTVTATPAGTGVNQGSLYINPATATADYTLLGLAVGGVEKFRLDADGDLTIEGDMAFTGSQTISTTAGDLILNPTGNLALSSNSITGLGTGITASGALTISTTGANNLTLSPGTGITTTANTFQITGGFLDLNTYADIVYSGASPGLTVTQSGAGNIVEFKDSTETKVSIDTSGNLDIKGAMFQPVYGTDDGLVGYWDMVEGVGEYARDKSSYGNDGTRSPDGTSGATVEDCEDIWSDESNVTPSADTSDYKAGSASAKFIVADAFTTGYIGVETISSTDLSSKDYINLWIKSSTTQSNLQLTLSESGTCTSAGIETATYKSINIPNSGGSQWKRVELDLGTMTDYNAVACIGLKATSDPGTVNIWLDDIQAYNGPIFADGKYGQAMQFDGADDYVDLGDDVGLEDISEFTIEQWIYIDSDFGAHTGALAQQEDCVYLQIGTNLKPIFQIHGGAQSDFDYTFSKEQWYHVVASFNGNTQLRHFYINGQGIGSGLGTGGLSTTPQSNYNAGIGGRQMSGTWNLFFDGLIDEVRVYNRALDADEIRTHYLRGQTTHGLVQADKFRVLDMSNQIVLATDATVGGTALTVTQSGAGDILNILDGSTEVLTILDGGNVGIGDTSPEFKLSLDNDGGILAKGTFGSGNTLSTAGAGTRLIWYPRKAAFRAGNVDGTQWNDANIGDYSVAMGNGTTASEYASVAMGYLTTASGDSSVAMGSGTTASEISSTAMGESTTASGAGSTAIGYLTTASGNYSTAMGESTTASGTDSTAMGYSTTASGSRSTAIGQEIQASGDYSFAIALNDQNGTNITQANTMAIMGGNVGIGDASPEFKLSLDNDGGILAKGTYGSGNTLTTAGAGTRLIWYPRKAAFRAGNVDGTQWNDANIGGYSTAMGYNATASGTGSTAMGYNATASGNYSTAMGLATTASGDYSTAMGQSTDASGSNSTAMGVSTTASGNYSTAMGSGTSASGNYSTAMGESTDASDWSSTAMGYHTTASGFFSVAMGNYTIASGNYSTAMGQEIQASGDYSFAIALNDQNGTNITQANTMAIMGGNVGIGDASPLSLLTVGNGDLFQVNSSGQVSAGTWQGTAIADTYVANDLTISSSGNIDAAALTSGIVASARLAGSYTGVTGTGTLTAGTWNATAITDAYVADDLTIASTKAGSFTYSGASTGLTVTQSGSGNVADFASGSYSVLTIKNDDMIELRDKSMLGFGSINDNLIDDMEVVTDWTLTEAAGSGETVLSLESSTVKTNDGAMKITTTTGGVSEGDYIRKTLSSVNLSNAQGYDRIGFWIRASETEQVISLRFYDSGGTTSDHDITIDRANYWQYEEWDISGISDANKDDIDWVDFYIDEDNNAPTFYIDQLRYYDKDARSGEMFVDGSGKLVIAAQEGYEIYTNTVSSLPSMAINSVVVEMNQPLSVNVAGDTGIAYDLTFLSTGISHITSMGPLVLSAGDTNNPENLTLTTQSNEASGDFGVATATSATTLTDSEKAWTADEWIGGVIAIVSGTGAGQTQTITDNTTTAITVADWDTSMSDPDTTSIYHLAYARGGDVLVDIQNVDNYYGGFKVAGADSGGYVFRIGPDGDVEIGGVGSGGSDLTVKQNIDLTGGNITIGQLDASDAGTLSASEGAESGGSCANANTYRYVIVALNDNGATAYAGESAGFQPDDGGDVNDKIQVSWDAISGATSYKLYRNTDNDWTDGDDSWVDGKVIPATTTAYIDDCSGDTGTQTPPTTNTTGGDITAYGGFKDSFSFMYSDVPDSQTDLAINVLGLSGNTEFILPYAGSVIGVSVGSNADLTGGTVTVDPTINGTKTGLTTALGDTDQYSSAVQAKDTDVFSAGNRLGIKMTTDANVEPNTIDIVVTVVIEY